MVFRSQLATGGRRRAYMAWYDTQLRRSLKFRHLVRIRSVFNLAVAGSGHNVDSYGNLPSVNFSCTPSSGQTAMTFGEMSMSQLMDRGTKFKP